jgi:hypothetical protein
LDSNGFNVYETTSGVAVLIASNLKTTSMRLDGLSATVHTFAVSARNSVTDSTTPVSEGPRSALFSGTPGTSATQTIAASTVTNLTNSLLTGSATIVALTATSISYARTGDNLSRVNVLSGSVTDVTNAALATGGTISSIPTANTFTFSKSGLPDVPLNTAVAGGVVDNTTNALFVTSGATVTAVDNTNLTVSYAKTAANVSSRATTGTITNRSNSIFNGTNLVLTAVTDTTLSYAKTSSNLVETGATGTAFNVTNSTVYNALPEGTGSVTIIDTPTYNTFTYARVASNLPTSIVTAPYGTSYRASTRAILKVKYRSGWLG